MTESLTGYSNPALVARAKDAAAELADRLKYSENAHKQALYALHSEAADLFEAVKTGDCWCEFGTGNPNARMHSQACVNVGLFVQSLGFRK